MSRSDMSQCDSDNPAKGTAKRRRSQFSISTFLIAVTVCGLIAYFASNWDPITNRLKFGSPIDLATVSVSGLGEGLVLQIGEDRVTTERSWRMYQIMSSALKGQMEISSVWQNQSEPGEYTILIDGRFFKTEYLALDRQSSGVQDRKE